MPPPYSREGFIAMVMMMLPFFFLFFFVLLVHEVKTKLRRAFKLSDGVHFVPQTYPFVGCLITYHKNRTRLLDWYTDLLAQSPSKTIVVWRLGAQRTIITANPHNVEYILKTNFRNYPKGKNFTDILKDFLGGGIFNVDGQLWQTQRKLVSHEFSTRSLRDHIVNTLRKEVQDRLLPALESAAKASNPIDLQDLLKRVSFNLIYKIALGIELASPLDLTLPDSPLARAFDISSAICARRGTATLSLSWKIKRWLHIGSERKLRDAVNDVHEHIERTIDEKMKKLETCEEHDLISRMIVAGYDKEMTRDMAISFILAGRDSTSAAMTWLFWLLSHHHDIRKEVLREVEMVLNGKGDDQMGYESLDQLHFLKACICESMRLYPPVVWDSKHAIADDLLPDGTVVKPGDRVTYFQYGMGRMETLWGKDRFEFKPDRWFHQDGSERGPIKSVSPFKFPVFQAGPRDCIGKQMAFLEMKYVVASVLQRFEFKPVQQSHPVFVPLLTAHMVGGFPAFVCKRDKC